MATGFPAEPTRSDAWSVEPGSVGDASSRRERSYDVRMAGELTHESPVRDAAWQRAARHAVVLSWVSLVWMTAEGVAGLLAGIAAGSIALIGWALSAV